MNNLLNSLPFIHFFCRCITFHSKNKDRGQLNQDLHLTQHSIGDIYTIPAKVLVQAFFVVVATPQGILVGP